MSRAADLSFDKNNNLPNFPSGYAYNCFPVRSNRRFLSDNGGAWLVEYRAKKKEQIENLLQKQLQLKKVYAKKKEKPAVELTTSYLVKRCCVEHPSDLCFVNISGNKLCPAEGEDFSSFQNVVSIDASVNKLCLETFVSFTKLEELQLQVNNISKCRLSSKDFLCLKKLDLSYNPLEEETLLILGRLRNLRQLNLQGCELSQLPAELARGYHVSKKDDVEQEEQRFPQLDSLDLSENLLTEISTFASLAGLQKLKVLNVSGNKITGIPHLRLMVAHQHFNLPTLDQQTINKDSSRDQCKINKSHYKRDSTLHDIVEEENTALDRNIQEKPMNPEGVNESQQLFISSGRDKDDSVKLIITDAVETETQLCHNGDRQNDTDDVINDVINNYGDAGKRNDETNDLLLIDFSGKELNSSLNDDYDSAQDGLGLRPNNLVAEDKQRGNAPDNLLTDGIKQPFVALELLDLSCNDISEERSLLALTSWPELKQLNLWGNPLMRLYRGIPPVIHHHLQKMCGVKVCKKEPNALISRRKIASAISATTNAYRVNTDIPPIKRNNLLMIEAAIDNALELKKSQQERETTKEVTQRNTKDESDSLNVHNDRPNDGGQTEAMHDREKVFLTQVEENEAEYKHETSEIVENVDTKYRGYELLLQSDDVIYDITEEPSLPPTIQGTIKALKSMLEHPLVFKKGEYNENKVELCKTKTKKVSQLKPLRRTPRSNRDNIENALDHIKRKDTTQQENLEHVLINFDTHPEIRKSFPTAKRLMKNVQKKYDEVRCNSLRPVSPSHRDFKHCSTRSEQPTRDLLLLARVKKNKLGDLYGEGSRCSTPLEKFRGTTPNNNTR